MTSICQAGHALGSQGLSGFLAVVEATVIGIVVAVDFACVVVADPDVVEGDWLEAGEVEEL